MRRLLLVAPVATALVLSSAGIGDSAPRTRVGYVTDAGATSDGAIGEHLYKGFVRAVRVLGVDGHVLQVSPGRAPDTALANFGRQRYDLIIAGGFLQRAPVSTAARRFPRSKFFYVTGPASTLDKRLGNVRGLVVHVEQAGYLAGYLAALVEARRRGKHVVGAVGGSAQVPDVQNYIGGYRAGARKADPSVTVLTDYVDDFANPAKCRAATQKEIAAGAGVVFEVAGGCGAGGLRVAKERHVWGIGVDTDQAGLGSHILTSAIFRPEDATYLAIRDLVGGTWRARSDVVLTLANGGVGLGRISRKVPPQLLHRLDTIRRRIAGGSIAIPRVPG